MSKLFTAARIRYAAVTLLVLAAGAGCAAKADNPGGTGAPPVDEPQATPTTPAATGTTPPGRPADGGGAGTGGGSGGGGTTKPPASSWPSPADCVSYSPAAVTVNYNAGYYTVYDGATVVLRVPGQSGDTVGQKALALAQRYRRHCYVGRTNNRAEHNSFVFDYWRDPSGMTPAIPGQDEDCSPYDRGNLTVEDMGGGDGWRVKDHDHVLQLFDNGTDARNGKLVLSKYQQICFFGDSDSDDPDQVSYMM